MFVMVVMFVGYSVILIVYYFRGVPPPNGGTRGVPPPNGGTSFDKPEGASPAVRLDRRSANERSE